MSSTGRRERNENDYYATPGWTVRRLFEDPDFKVPGGRWLEPGAGEGDLINAANSLRSDINWCALELRPECQPILEAIKPKPEIIITDRFIVPDRPADEMPPLWGQQFQVALGNPPFNLAMEFIEESLKVCEHVVFLLRLNYVGSEKRHEFMRNCMPDIYVLPNRPSFVHGGTDSIEYAWFHWSWGNLNRTSGRIKMLQLTHKDERKVSRPKNLTLK